MQDGAKWLLQFALRCLSLLVLKEVRPKAEGREPKEKPWRDRSYWVILWLAPRLMLADFYRAQDHLCGHSTTCSGLNPPLSVINQDHSSEMWLQVSLMDKTGIETSLFSNDPEQTPSLEKGFNWFTKRGISSFDSLGIHIWLYYNRNVCWDRQTQFTG